MGKRRTGSATLAMPRASAPKQEGEGVASAPRWPHQENQRYAHYMNWRQITLAPGTMHGYTAEEQAKMVEKAKADGYTHEEGVRRISALLTEAKGYHVIGSDGKPTTLYEASKHWYSEAHAVAVDLASHYKNPQHATVFSVPQAAAIIAATSPRNYWTAYPQSGPNKNKVVNPNLEDAMQVMSMTATNRMVTVSEEAIQTYTGGKHGLTPEQVAEARAYLAPGGGPRQYHFNDLPPWIASMAPEFKEGPSRSRTPRPNIIKAIEIARLPNTAQGVKRIPHVLSGNKVRSFYNNIMFPEEAGGSVTVDAHMMAGLFNYDKGTRAERSALSDTIKGRAATDYYPLLAQAIREAGAAHGLTPDQAQAIAWTSWREKQGFDNTNPAKHFWGPIAQARATMVVDPSVIPEGQILPPVRWNGVFREWNPPQGAIPADVQDENALWG